MKDQDQITKTEETRELLMSDPGWGYRWGITLVFTALLALLLLSRYVSYPVKIRYRTTVKVSEGKAVFSFYRHGDAGLRSGQEVEITPVSATEAWQVNGRIDVLKPVDAHMVEVVASVRGVADATQLTGDISIAIGERSVFEQIFRSGKRTH